MDEAIHFGLSPSRDLASLGTIICLKAFQTAGNCEALTTFTKKRSLNHYFHRVQTFIQVKLAAKPYFSSQPLTSSNNNELC